MAEMQSKFPAKDWRDLAAAATRETDPEKLGHIIEELCGALDKRQGQKEAQATRPTKKSA